MPRPIAASIRECASSTVDFQGVMSQKPAFLGRFPEVIVECLAGPGKATINPENQHSLDVT